MAQDSVQPDLNFETVFLFGFWNFIHSWCSSGLSGLSSSGSVSSPASVLLWERSDYNAELIMSCLFFCGQQTSQIQSEREQF